MQICEEITFASIYEEISCNMVPFYMCILRAANLINAEDAATGNVTSHARYCGLHRYHHVSLLPINQYHTLLYSVQQNARFIIVRYTLIFTEQFRTFIPVQTGTYIEIFATFGYVSKLQSSGFPLRDLSKFHTYLIMCYVYLCVNPTRPPDPISIPADNSEPLVYRKSGFKHDDKPSTNF